MNTADQQVQVPTIAHTIMNYISFFRTNHVQYPQRVVNHRLTIPDKFDQYLSKYYHATRMQLRNSVSGQHLSQSQLGTIYHVVSEFNLQTELRGEQFILHAFCAILPRFQYLHGPIRINFDEDKTCSLCGQKNLVYKYIIRYINFQGQVKIMQLGVNCASLLNARRQRRLVSAVYPEMISAQNSLP